MDMWICLDETDAVFSSDWRARAGPRNRPTEKEREEHQATHVSFSDWCTHCMMGRGCPSVEKTHYCDGLLHHEIRRISDLHRGERIQTSEHHEQRRVEKKESRNRGRFREWRNSLTCVTLKSDAERAIITLRSRVAEMWKAEVNTEDGMEGDKESKWLIENIDADTWNNQRRRNTKQE